MYDTILITTDGSSGAEAATACGLEIAETYDAAVHVLSVIDTSWEPEQLSDAERKQARGAAKERAQAAIQAIRNQTEAIGLDATPSVVEGVPHQRILSYADEQDADLVVMGTHGRTGADFDRLGSTTERVITLGDVPVLSVRSTGDDEDVSSGLGAYNRVVIPTDGSDFAERAAEHGLGIAERYGADVHVVYVVDRTIYDLQDDERSIVGPLEEAGENAVESIAAEARDRNLPVVTDVFRGEPSEELRNYARNVDGDLLVLGTRGQSARTDQLLGSTTARIVQRSEIPVLVV